MKQKGDWESGAKGEGGAGGVRAEVWRPWGDGGIRDLGGRWENEQISMAMKSESSE